MGSNAQAIAAIGLQAQQMNLETIANNLTNAMTPGFKSGRVSFQELMSAQSATGDAAAAVSGAGAGVLAGTVVKDFAAGKLTSTTSPFDLAVQGAGLIEVDLPDGTVGYVRGGSLQVNADGLLATAQGYPLRPHIQIPRNLSALTIGADGKVSAVTAEQPAGLELGQIAMAGFTNPDGLRASGNGIYLPTDQSGAAMAGHAGEDGMGTLSQRSLEASNVNMIDEMSNLIAAQRAFQMNSKAFEAADQIDQMANNILR